MFHVEHLLICVQKGEFNAKNVARPMFFLLKCAKFNVFIEKYGNIVLSVYKKEPLTSKSNCLRKTPEFVLAHHFMYYALK